MQIKIHYFTEQGCDFILRELQAWSKVHNLRIEIVHRSEGFNVVSPAGHGLGQFYVEEYGNVLVSVDNDRTVTYFLLSLANKEPFKNNYRIV